VSPNPKPYWLNSTPKPKRPKTVRPYTWDWETPSEHERRQEWLRSLDRVLHEIEEHNVAFGGKATPPITIRMICWCLGVPRSRQSGYQLHDAILSIQATHVRLAREERSEEMKRSLSRPWVDVYRKSPVPVERALALV
jgi:hypothetical protein